jgi:hypothetical protein
MLEDLRTGARLTREVSPGGLSNRGRSVFAKNESPFAAARLLGGGPDLAYAA